MWLSKWDAAFPWLLLTASFLVCAAWVAHYPPALTVYDGAVSMKFTTAAMFFMWGVAVLAGHYQRWSMVGLSAAFSVAVMAVFSAIGFDGEFLPYALRDTTDETVAAGLPSLGTLVAFFILGVAGLMKGSHPHFDARAAGCTVMTIGLIAVLGHAFDEPAMRYFLPGLSTAMAIHTAVLFVLCGERLARYKLIV